MNRIELKELIKELILKEYRMEPSVLKLIDEYGELNDEIDELKNRLEGLKSRYSEIENHIRPLLEELRKYGHKSVQTEKYLISIKRMGYEKVNLKYKETFEEGLKKVNKQTRKLLEELLQSTSSISNVVSSIGVQRVKEEGLFTDVFRRLKGLVMKVVPSLKRMNTEMDMFQLVMKKMVN
jgi:chromosome segregation ATPase